MKPVYVGPFVVPWILAALLVSCASTSVVQRFDIGYSSMSQSYDIAKELRQAGFISDSDWPQVLSGLDRASDELDKAWALYKADPAAAEKQLTTVEGVVAEIKRLLIARQKESANSSDLMEPKGGAARSKVGPASGSSGFPGSPGFARPR